jgi:hypothetical protein
MHVKGQGRNGSSIIFDQGDQKAQIIALKSLPLSRIAELSAILEDAHVSNKPLLSDMAGLSHSKDCSINKGVDSINFKNECMNKFKATQTEAEDNDFSFFRHSEESGKHLSTTQHLVEDDTLCNPIISPSCWLLAMLVKNNIPTTQQLLSCPPGSAGSSVPV